VAPATVVVGLVLGLVLGSAAGFFGGWVDQLIMRLSDVLFAFPGLLFAILLAATVQPRIESWLSQFDALRPFVRSGYSEFFVVIFALSMVGWPGLARLIRGQILALREQPFVEAAYAIGVPPWQILRRHLLPNALTPVIVSVSMGLGGAILAESTLSFFGIGIQPPTASWGGMIFANFSFWRQPSALWLVWAPGLVVGLLVFAFNFVGDGLNEALGR
jgi:ABC-type dipeptide/oligopeptide/nickel transport system permease subunit